MLATSTQITREFKKLRPAPEWAFDDAGRSETNYITHGYHRYPAKFIPNIVKKIIEDYTRPGDIVVDPFGGCGTTLVEAKVSGRKSYGFDINPVAKLITQTKISPILPKTLDNTLGKFTKIYDASEPQPPIIRNERLGYWFEDSTLKELNRIYVSIKKIKNYNARRFYLCAFSHILKNCSRWLMKSIKPTIDKDKEFPTSFEVFSQHLRFMTKRNNQFFELLKTNGNLKVFTKMRIADSTKKLPLGENTADLIITSPPYVTSYEYADLHQLSLLWFGNDKTLFKKWGRHTEDFNGFRKKFIGTSLRKSTRKEVINSSIGEEIIKELSLKEVGTARSVAHYFSDMNKSFIEIFRILKHGGRVAIIIGDTILHGIHVANSEVAVEQMQNMGLTPVELIKREITNKMITPWRDDKNGRFTGINNPDRKRVYQYEYILIMQKA